METYLTEEERLEALQRWWKANKQSVFAGLILGLLIIVGWKMWQGNQHKKGEQASALYQQIIRADEAKQAETVLTLGQRLLEAYPSTAYADYTRLYIAKTHVAGQDLAGARQVLEEQLAKGDDEALKTLTRLRLGQVMLAQGEIEPALKLLEPASDQAVGRFAGLFAELRGDLYAAAQRSGEARQAYEKAVELGNRSPLLPLKISDLPAAE